MKVIVCVKQIPDPALPGELDPATNTLKRDGKLILDESDSYGVEMALQLVDAAGGGEVALVSMAPNGEVSGLRTALAMGAAQGVLVSDPELAGSDALTTAKVLAAAVQRLGGAGLGLAGAAPAEGRRLPAGPQRTVPVRQWKKIQKVLRNLINADSCYRKKCPCEPGCLSYLFVSFCWRVFAKIRALDCENQRR